MPRVAELSDQEMQDAKDRLELAIRQYYETMEPESFVSGYVLVTHKESLAHHERGSIVGVLVPTDQPWPVTVGLLVTASDQQRGLGRDL